MKKLHHSFNRERHLEFSLRRELWKRKNDEVNKFNEKNCLDKRVHYNGKTICFLMQRRSQKELPPIELEVSE